jgi:hypothetical protein
VSPLATERGLTRFFVPLRLKPLLLEALYRRWRLAEQGQTVSQPIDVIKHPKTSVSVEALLQIIDFIEGQSSN